MGPRGMRMGSGKCFTMRNHSANIIRVIRSRRLRWADNVARMKKSRSAFKMLTSKPTGKRPSGNRGVDGRTILEWTLKR